MIDRGSGFQDLATIFEDYVRHFLIRLPVSNQQDRNAQRRNDWMGAGH